MKILHFAAENFARVPGNLVRAERVLGHESLLMTLYPSAHGFHDEDICLNAPFVKTPAVLSLKRLLRPGAGVPGRMRRTAESGPPVWAPANPFSERLIRLRDRIWAPRIRKALTSIRIETFDILFLDGGLGFLRYDTFARGLKEGGMKIAVGYYGSDLRTRGILPDIDGLADYRFTMEFDHTLLYPGIDFMFYPFRLPAYTPRSGPRNASGGARLRIGHSPTNRAAKGTDVILRQLSLLRDRFPLEIVLIEKLPQDEALSLKSTCDLFVDQIGELGYGVSGVESMAMGIPTAAEILPDFEAVLGDHPIINVSSGSIAEKLTPYLQSERLRRERGEQGRAWVERVHDPAAVASKLLNALHP
jgi:hypothetical protein